MTISARHAEVLARLDESAERNHRRRHNDTPTITLAEAMDRIRAEETS